MSAQSVLSPSGRREYIPAARWGPVYSSPLLKERTRLEIEAAIAVIETRRKSWTNDHLAEAIAEYLDEQERRAAYLALPRHNGYTEQEWDGIIDVMRDLATARCHSCGCLMRPVYDLSETREYWEEIQKLRRFAAALLDYIEGLP